MRVLRITSLLFVCVFGLTHSISIARPITTPSISKAIDLFVSQLYPEGSHYFWVINDTTKESSNEMVVDIKTNLQGDKDQEANQHRFLLLVVKGELFATQKIPLGAKVNCKQEEQV